MTAQGVWRRLLLPSLAAALVAAPGLRAQTIVTTISARVGDSISPAPVINIVANAVSPDLQPTFIRLLISTGSPFQTPFLVRLANGTSAELTMDALLPERTRVFLRSQLLDRNGTIRAERVDTADVRSWLRLETPARPTNSLFTRTPRFEWSSPGITLPPGPWRYKISIVNIGSGSVEQERSDLSATSYIADALQACTPYRWSVTAVAENSSTRQEVTVNSGGTFVIFTAECPSATVFFQNFPNPFGRDQQSDKTCFWFDLAHRSPVRLTIYDVRLRPVRRIVPSARVGTVLDSGAYGRASPTGLTGCDPNFEWDGRDDRGRTVPTGVYIAIFEADGRRDSKKMMFVAP